MERKLSYRIVGLAAAVLTADQFSKLAATVWSPTGAGQAAGITVGPFGIVPVSNPNAMGGLDVRRVRPSPARGTHRRHAPDRPLAPVDCWFPPRCQPRLGDGNCNLTDRVRVGHVIDFISVDFGSAQVILNIAEVALFVGLPLLVLAARSADGHASSRIGHLGGLQT